MVNKCTLLHYRAWTGADSLIAFSHAHGFPKKDTPLVVPLFGCSGRVD